MKNFLILKIKNDEIKNTFCRHLFNRFDKIDFSNIDKEEEQMFKYIDDIFEIEVKNNNDNLKLVKKLKQFMYRKDCSLLLNISQKIENIKIRNISCVNINSNHEKYTNFENMFTIYYKNRKTQTNVYQLFPFITFKYKKLTFSIERYYEKTIIYMDS